MNVKSRKCIGCLNTFDRETMFRILKKHNTNEIVISPSNKDFGRSVYICKNKNCVEKAFKKGKIAHFLKYTGDIDSLKKNIELKLPN